MEYLSGDSEFRHLQNSAIVNDFGETMTTYRDNTLPFDGDYLNLGGRERRVKRVQRRDDKHNVRIDKRQGTAAKRKEGTILANAALASTQQQAPSGARKAPKADNKKKILIGVGIAAAIVLTLFLIKKK